MKNIGEKFTKVGVGALVAGAAIALPVTAAFAVGYVPESNITVSDSTPAPGGTTTVGFSAGSFTGGESVTFVLEGENAAGATLAVVVSPAVVNTQSITKTAASDGSTSVSVTLPSDASGAYTLTGTGASSGNIASVTLTASSGSGDTATVVDTSANDTALWLWAAGGAVVLAGGAIVTGVTISRKRVAA